MTAVMISEMTIDPKQPNLFEKKKNIRHSTWELTDHPAIHEGPGGSLCQPISAKLAGTVVPEWRSISDRKALRRSNMFWLVYSRGTNTEVLIYPSGFA